MFKFKYLSVFAVLGILMLAAPAEASHRDKESFWDKIKTIGTPTRHPDERTARRNVSGDNIVILYRRERQDLGDNLRTWSAKHFHPQQWEGRDWNPAQWEGTGWDAKTVIEQFYAGRYLDNQYRDRLGTPILVVGPNFYNLSYHDKRRIVKLLADYHEILDTSTPSIVLIDWFTKDWVGQYSEAGGLDIDQEYAP